MSDEHPIASRDRVAAAFDRTSDPLAEHATTFDRLEIDPFDVFLEDALSERDITDKTVYSYRIAIENWQAFMAEQDRHAACPNEAHVAEFIDYLADEHDNHPTTIKAKVRRVREAYAYWQDAPEFPHERGFDPFELVLSSVSFDVPEKKSPPPLTTGEIAAVLRSVTHLRDRAIILLQLKCGLRASEVCNIKLAEIDVQSEPLQTHYDDLGTHWTLDSRPNALYIPHDRERNKSGRPRVIPLDQETQALLERYLLARRDAPVPWLFLPKDRRGQLTHHIITDVWTDAFQPMYEETKHHRSVTSHFGRHFFTTYWRVEQDLPRSLVQYLRGDGPATESILEKDGIDHYIHSHYEDVEEPYRENIFEIIQT